MHFEVVPELLMSKWGHPDRHMKRLVERAALCALVEKNMKMCMEMNMNMKMKINMKMKHEHENDHENEHENGH